ncbi:ICOS ligand-like [Misgurnus anguillicaudatus]|uniref:ICOS ligand-like n=1 Tax=Misgurnus anguillicaudatus TaxID=75329 RepID=UPI003CCFDBCE
MTRYWYCSTMITRRVKNLVKDGLPNVFSCDEAVTSYCIICVFALLINKVSLQDVNVAEGVTGGSVVLPCATNQTEHKLSGLFVQWRHNDSLNVCDIIEGTCSLQHQDFTYKNRAETFPTEYKKGNFSIKLNNLTQTDAGGYWCYILHLDDQVILITQLTIKVHTDEQTKEENGNQARERLLWIIFAVLGVFMLCLVLCIIWKKRCEEPSRPVVTPVVKYMPCQNNTKVHENGNVSKSAQE